MYIYISPGRYETSGRVTEMARAMTRLAGFSEAVGCTRPSIVLESRPLCVGTCGQRCMVPVIHLYPTKDVTNAPGALTTDVGGGEPDADHTTLSAIRERAACCPVRKTRADMCLGGGRRDFVTRGWCWWDSVSVGYRRPAKVWSRPHGRSAKSGGGLVQDRLKTVPIAGTARGM